MTEQNSLAATVSEPKIELEMSRIVLGGMQGQTELDESIADLVEHFGIESDVVTPLDIAKDVQELTIDWSEGLIAESERDERLKEILSRALVAKSPLE